MPDDTNTPNEFPGDIDNYTPAIIVLKRYVAAARADVETAIAELDKDYNTSKANIESATLLTEATLNSEMTTARASVRDGYTSSGDAFGDIEEPLVSLDKWVVGTLGVNANKPAYNSPVFYYEGSWYNHKLLGASLETELQFSRSHEFVAEDEGIPAAYVGDLSHGLVLRNETHRISAHAVQDGEVMAIIEDDPFFGNMIVIRQVDGYWARYYHLANDVRWDYLGEHLPRLRVGDAVHAGEELRNADSGFFVDVCYTDRLKLNYYDWGNADLETVRENYLILDRVGSEAEPAFYKTGTYYEQVIPALYIYPTDSMIEGTVQTINFRLNKPPDHDVTVTIGSLGAPVTFLEDTTFTFTADNWRDARGIAMRAEETDEVYVDEGVVVVFHCVSDGEFNGLGPSRVIPIMNDDEEPDPELPAAIEFFSFPSAMDEGQTKVFQIRLTNRPMTNVTITPLSTQLDVITFQSPGEGPWVFTPGNYKTTQSVVIRCPFRSIQSDDVVRLSFTPSGNSEYQAAGVFKHVSVKNIDFNNEEPEEEPVDEPTEGPVPNTPVGLTGIPASTSVLLAWDASEDTTLIRYEIQVDNGPWMNIPIPAGEVVNQYRATDLIFETAYVFRLRAVNEFGNSGTAFISATTLAKVVAPAPLDLMADPTKKKIHLDWLDPNGAGVVSEDVYEVSTDGGNTWITPSVNDLGPRLYCTIVGLKKGTEYDVRLRIVDGLEAQITVTTNG